MDRRLERIHERPDFRRGAGTHQRPSVPVEVSGTEQRGCAFGPVDEQRDELRRQRRPGDRSRGPGPNRIGDLAGKRRDPIERALEKGGIRRRGAPGDQFDQLPPLHRPVAGSFGGKAESRG